MKKLLNYRMRTPRFLRISIAWGLFYILTPFKVFLWCVRHPVKTLLILCNDVEVE